MAKCIKVAVSLPPNYQTNWKELKLQISGWDETESAVLKESHLKELSDFHRWGWLESCEVRDAGDSPLPDVLHVVVLCSKEYDGIVGGTSWSATVAFVSAERAQEYADRNEERLYWFWALPVRRCGLNPG